MLSEPVRVHLAGWESDTLTLQRSGWELSAEQDVVRGSMQLMIRHQALGLLGLSKNIAWEYHNDPRWMQHVRLPILQIEHFGRTDRLWVPMTASLGSFRGGHGPSFEAIDAMPSFITEEPRRLEDLAHFATLHQKRILLPEETVSDLMKRIIEMQQPGREAHFLKQAKQAPRLEAQILSFCA